MKVIAVNGISKSGKTTICETIIKGLRARGYTVGSVKEIHFESFKIDPNPSSNTNRHSAAGAQLVTARGMAETDILYPYTLSIEDILKHYDHDYVILEGVTDCNAPRIITAHNEDEVKERIDGRAILASGVIANSGVEEIAGLPVINALANPNELIDFVVDNAFEPLPSFDPECCSECGYSCRELAGLIANKKATIEQCVLSSPDIELKIDGYNIDMVPFVQKILKNAILGIASELSGFNKNSEIEIRFKS
ncbi:MAG: molybdopterin-guanine dinucleotide biosynthesis protein MobB [Eubacteriales bacterium]